jgi:hypothetical protein
MKRFQIALFIAAAFFASNYSCRAIDPRLHKIDIQSWGQETAGIQISFGLDKKELKDDALQYVTVEFIIKNDTNFRRIFAERPYGLEGIVFVSRAGDGNERKVLSDPPSRGLSNFIHVIAPHSSECFYLRMKKTDLVTVANAAAYAQLTIREGDANDPAPVAPFKVEVPIVIPG